MGYFEQYPWLAIVLIVVTVELWNALKSVVSRTLASRRNRTARD
jgi:heme exporter protein D